MLQTAVFTFNPFEENTYVVHNGREAVVVDPGCWNAPEQGDLEKFLADNDLRPLRLVLTHAHIDHILGCGWMYRRYGLLPELHAEDLPVLRAGASTAQLFGLPYETAPEPRHFLAAGDTIRLGMDELRVLFVPGHAPGHIALYSAAQRFVISGDVLFKGSVGRVDLPGGDMGTLLHSINQVLLPLGDDVIVHCGHGPDTTIGRERISNPYLRERGWAGAQG